MCMAASDFECQLVDSLKGSDFLHILLRFIFFHFLFFGVVISTVGSLSSKKHMYVQVTSEDATYDLEECHDRLNGWRF